MSCPDGPGIVAAISGFLFGKGANILASDQFSTHPERGAFYMRTVFFLPELEREHEEFEAAFGALAQRFSMSWRISYPKQRRRVALMASRADHCLMDLLWRTRRGELDMEIACVISNHELLREEVEALGVSYVHPYQGLDELAVGRPPISTSNALAIVGPHEVKHRGSSDRTRVDTGQHDRREVEGLGREGSRLFAP